MAMEQQHIDTLNTNLRLTSVYGIVCTFDEVCHYSTNSTLVVIASISYSTVLVVVLHATPG